MTTRKRRPCLGSFPSIPTPRSRVPVYSPARDAGMIVIHVVVAFRPGHPEVSPRNPLFSAVKANGMVVAGTEGAAIHPAAAAQPRGVVVAPHRPFIGTAWVCCAPGSPLCSPASPPASCCAAPRRRLASAAARARRPSGCCVLLARSGRPSSPRGRRRPVRGLLRASRLPPLQLVRYCAVSRRVGAPLPDRAGSSAAIGQVRRGRRRIVRGHAHHGLHVVEHHGGDILSLLVIEIGRARCQRRLDIGQCLGAEVPAGLPSSRCVGPARRRTPASADAASSPGDR